MTNNDTIISDDMKDFLRQHFDIDQSQYHIGEESIRMTDETRVIKVYNSDNLSFNLEDCDYQRIEDISIKLSLIIPEYVPKIYVTHKLPNELAIIMEKLDGQPLYKYMNNKDNDYNPNEVLSIVTSLHNAFTAMNNACYIHGNVNAKHIMVDKNFSVKLIDFTHSDVLTAVDPGDGITPKIILDSLMLSDIIAQLIFIKKPSGSVYEVIKSIENFTVDDIIGDKETATKLSNILNVYRYSWIYND
jgi:tRNA A-37 threonylcarbamoyl transferase component Bud32